jgi:hypothetical protein
MLVSRWRRYEHHPNEIQFLGWPDKAASKPQGTRCIIVDVSALEISALVVRGYLPEEARTDPKAIKLAIEGVISDMAFELQQERLIDSESRF